MKLHEVFLKEINQLVTRLAACVKVLLSKVTKFQEMYLSNSSAWPAKDFVADIYII